MKGTHKTRKTCRFCKDKDLGLVLDMGLMPHAGNFLKRAELGKELYYPLRIYYCRNCSLVQVCDIPNRDTLFSDYKYASSYSLSSYFERLAKKLSKIIKKGDFVFEIGSNDGVLLQPLKKLGFKVLGIDPAKNIAEIANSRGIETIVDYFSAKVATEVVTKYGEAELILANNVLAHIDDMDDIAKGIKKLLREDGIFIFEVHYLPDLINKLQYDFFYNEHLCYYLVTPLKKFWEKNGLAIFKVEKTMTHGGSIRVYLKHKSNTDRKINKSVKHFCDYERKNNLLTEKTYLDFSEKVKLHKVNFLKFLNNLNLRGHMVVGYGASGRANTILNYCGVTTDQIEYIVDESPLRYGRFTPGSHIPIKRLDYFKKDKNVKYCILFAASYKKQVLAKNREFIKNGGCFIIPLEI